MTEPTKQINVCFCTASRSERALIEPLLKRLEENPRYNLYIFELPISPMQVMNLTSQLINGYTLRDGFPEDDDERDFMVLTTSGRTFDIAFCPFDRPEMLAAAFVFFRNNIPVVQLHAGDRSLEGTHDDIIRHLLTLLSTYQFCTGVQSYLRTLALLGITYKSQDHCREIGFIQFDDIDIDYSKVPTGKYNLVVYNPPTRMPNTIPTDLDEIESIINRLGLPTIWIEPNEDPGRDLVLARAMMLDGQGKVRLMGTVSRNQYLGLLQQSTNCIGNSSSFFLELPYFGKTHIHVGSRNKGREIPQDAKPGGCDRIIKYLDEWLK